MPTWNLNYQIWVNCTQEDLYREQQVFQNDPLCVNYQSTDSTDYQGVVSVQVEFNESVGGESLQTLQSRSAEAVPAVRANPIVWNGSRYEVQMSTEGSQEDQLLINAQVSIDEQGRLGTHGTPIGIIAHVDRGNNQARVIIEPGTPLELIQRQNQVNSHTLFTRAEILMRQQIMADEDARVFEALDAAQEVPPRNPRPKKPKPAPEPRPVFKTRYQRIMDALKEGSYSGL